VWLLMLGLLGGFLYVNQVGLPGFIKRPLLQRLHARGLDLQFSRLRLRWYEGIVAENVRFVRADEPMGPSLTLKEVQVPLNFKALRRLQLQVDALVLRQGRLVWPVIETNQSVRELAIDKIQTDLRFLPEDQWALDNFQAVFAGADLRLSGVVTNASYVRDWRFLKGEQAAPTPADIWQKRLRVFADTLQQIRFSAAPDLRLEVRGDARDLQSFSVRLHVAAPGATTPWGAVAKGHFSGRVFPASSNELVRGEFSIEAANAQTPWGAITNFVLGMRLSGVPGQSNLVQGAMNLSAGRVETRWAQGSNATLSATWVHDLTNMVPALGEGRFQCADARTEWGRAEHLLLTARFTPPAPATPGADVSWGWWTNLPPHQASWECSLSGVESPRLTADEISCAGAWSAPRLSVTNFAARLYGGGLNAEGVLDVATRVLRARAVCDIDPHRIEPLLNESGRVWLERFAWEQPPRAAVEVSVTLPAWTNRQPDWRGEVQPTLFLQGEINLERGVTYYGDQAAPTNGTRYGLQFNSVCAHVLYSNECWQVPDLVLTRPEGRLSLEHRVDGRTKDFYVGLSSTMDVGQIQPLLEAKQQRAFDYFVLTQPPEIEAEIWGRLREPERLGIRGRIAATNFTFRGESVSSLKTALLYTNRVLQCFEPEILCGERRAIASGVTADFNRQLVYLTNGFSTAAPQWIASIIGPHIVRAIQPYEFLEPPTGHVYGTIPMRGEAGADLHFDLEGGPFHWWRFQVPHISGHVHWAGESLTLSNMQMDFYQGRATGEAGFDFQPRGEADLRFRVAATNVQFQALMTDLTSKSNHLEGRLSANLFVTAGNTADLHSINGHGDLDLRDGVIWDIPLFGIFSPVLNGIAPGLGNSRATGAACSFVMTNGVCRTDNLEIRAGGMRLNYRGTVDLESKVNARVDAELLRDMWLVGPVVSTMFWPVTKMFEYKVTGALSDPKMDPVYVVPHVVLFPFHPIRTIKGLLPEESSGSQTNAAPQFSPLP
jgi:hypothetical protein